MDSELLEELLTGVISRLKYVGDAISADAAPGHDATGGAVSSLSEAIMGVTSGLCKIADALNNIANAMDKHDV